MDNTEGLNIGRDDVHDALGETENSIESCYHAGRDYYEQSCISLLDMEYEDESSLQKLAIEYLNKSLMQTGTSTEQLTKIHTALLLTKIPSKDLTQADREKYFYHAVEIGERYLRKSFFSTQYGKDVLSVYLSDINRTFGDTFPKEFMPQLVQLLCTVILSESHARIEERLRKATDTKAYLENVYSTSMILDKLKDAFGPVRLLIVSKDSSEIVSNNRFQEHEIDPATTSPRTQCLPVVIFDRSRKYLINIDRGSNEPANQFSAYELQYIINPLLDAYIKQLEHTFFTWNLDNSSFIETAEAKAETLSETNDYRGFVSQVISEYVDFSKIHGPKEKYIDEILMALDICRSVTRFNRKDGPIFKGDLSEEIDRILGGKIQRRVLRMVKSMFLSRNETMNGSGYPFGLNKRTIPLEGKIYAIIRAYEALGKICKSVKQTQGKMDEWSQGGYFDRSIYVLFSRSIESEGILPKILRATSPLLPEFEQRKNRYTPFIRTWRRIMEITKAIEVQYDEGRGILCNQHTQKESFQEISALTGELIREIDTRSIIVVGRHGLTQSDKDGISGAKSESLAFEGELTSHEIGEKFRGLVIDIYSGDLPRANETAEIIRQEVIAGLTEILSYDTDKPETNPSMLCPIYTEDSLTNPDKYLESYWRRRRSRSRLSTIILDERTKPMAEFLEDLDSPSMETTVLLMTHGHNANIITELLENYFRGDRISSEKTSMVNGAVCAYFLQGGDGSKKLLFPVMDWKNTLKELNRITMRVFGELFYDASSLQTDVILLHDEFLDFIDNNAESSPEKWSELSEQLKLNPFTVHFPDILKVEGVIK